MTTIHLNGEGLPEPARPRPKTTRNGSMRGWLTALYVSGLAASLLAGEVIGWLMPWLAGAGRGLSFLASMLVAAMAAIAYVAGFKYLVMDHHH
jgi:hypothetical protein